MPKLKNGDTVRFRKGRTVDTMNVEGGDLRGCKATVCSQVFEADGANGTVKGEKRVMVAVEPEGAPRYTGFVTAPIENIEPGTRWGRLKATVAGIGDGLFPKNYGYEAPPLKSV